MTKEITDWEKVNAHKFSKIENNLMQKIFSEYINPKHNSAFEDLDGEEARELFLAFKQGWLMATIMSEE